MRRGLPGVETGGARGELVQQGRPAYSLVASHPDRCQSTPHASRCGYESQTRHTHPGGNCGRKIGKQQEQDRCDHQEKAHDEKCDTQYGSHSRQPPVQTSDRYSAVLSLHAHLVLAAKAAGPTCHGKRSPGRLGLVLASALEEPGHDEGAADPGQHRGYEGQ
jgi:hypothetical protein